MGSGPTTSTASTSTFAQCTPLDVVERVDRGEADWGYTTAGIYFDPSLGLVAKYGINRSRFFVRPGFTLRMLAFNSARPVFQNNPKPPQGGQLRPQPPRDHQRRERSARQRPHRSVSPVESCPASETRTSTRSSVLIWRKRETLARGQPARRQGRALHEQHPAADGGRAHRRATACRDRARCRGPRVPAPYRFRLRTTPSSHNPGEPWDIALALWQPELRRSLRVPQPAPGRAVRRRHELHPLQLEPLQPADAANGARAPGRRAEPSVRGAGRSGSHGRPRPLAAVDFLKEPTLVSPRVGCIVLRPVLDLTAVCLK